ncbi:molybdenum cofactor biosynthesis protein MoaE [Maritalea myrionectae]|uniref:molybdenum cofactor biosynthesis protein MoaE n=1 Tax=Maritalea myrionectae TaxID=454601 RepID=UPI00040CEC0E|nr:molybdenum cofactor biosynthesis protein MoaE [Maritalea myrionectae]
MMGISVTIQAEIFDAGDLVNQFTRDMPEAGAVATFTGLVRSKPEQPIKALILEHHPTMAQKQIERFAQEAVDKFDLLAIQVVHRFGEMKVGEPIVQVMAASSHRQAAFDGANYVMDWLKTDAPFWKKEVGADGAHWVEARDKDEAAKNKWTK